MRAGNRLRGLGYRLAACVGKLARDQRGNTLALIAAAVIPVMAAIGGGVDISRAYLAQARLQQAVDSAALAGRRSRIGTGMTEATEAANKFLSFNFPQSSYGASPSHWTSSITGPDTSSVRVQAATKIPTTIMKLFGIQTVDIGAVSIARQNWINTDIVLVLDTTGSMRDTPRNDKQSKIQSLRDAVMSLYDELTQAQNDLTSRGLRLRYAVVPYSSAVNVGRVLTAAEPTGKHYVRRTAPYYSYGCISYRANGNCRTYGNAEFDIDVTSRLTSTSTWDGCIEERQTVSTITSSSGYTIPTGAKDLNINLVPTTDLTTQWPAYLPALVEGKSQVACPTEAKRLATWTRADLKSYVDKLNPDGGTYHDIGMIWGARFISTGGVFANPDEFNGAPVNRHIIFMTDGLLDTGGTLYSSYGVESYQKRVSGGGSDLNGRHKQRFLMACNAAKSLNVSIWTIAFATGADGTLTTCASASDMAVTASNQDQLNSRFQEIGRSIGKLRIAQ